MKKEDYVSLEVAKLLKENGYDEPVISQYTKSGSVWYCNESENFNESADCYSRPTLYEAQKWLREERQLFITVTQWYSVRYQIIEFDYRIAGYFDLLEKQGKRIKSKEYYEKYEECLNAAILKALEMIKEEKK